MLDDGERSAAPEPRAPKLGPPITDPGPAPALPARPLPLMAGPSWPGVGACCCWAGRPAEAQHFHGRLYASKSYDDGSRPAFLVITDAQLPMQHQCSAGWKWLHMGIAAGTQDCGRTQVRCQHQRALLSHVQVTVSNCFILGVLAVQACHCPGKHGPCSEVCAEVWVTAAYLRQ